MPGPSNSVHEKLPESWKIIGMHAAAWLLFIAYELCTLFFVTGQWGNLWADLCFYVLHIALFYFHAGFVLPRAFDRSSRPFATLLFLLLAELCIYLLLKYGLSFLIDHLRLSFSDIKTLRSYIIVNGWRGIYFLVFSSVYWILRRMFSYRSAAGEAERQQLALLKHKAEMERDLADVNNAYLQQQINPHFLFNTLNFVYNTVYKSSPAASECILQLSDMMHYSLRSYGKGAAGSLLEEIAQIRNLIAVNRLRYDYQLPLVAELAEPEEDVPIIPLVLLTFTENVFNHANLKDPARISLAVEPGVMLKFETQNAPKNKVQRPGHKGTGVDNAIRRLNYAYGDRYRLDITDNAEEYSLALCIKL